MPLDINVIAEKVKDLKTLPSSFARINQLIQDPQSSASDLGKVISQDQVLSVKLLKIVNSAFYGFPSKINSLAHAVTIVGFSGVRDLVLCTAVIDVFIADVAGSSFNRTDFWKHSLACALVSKTLAKYSRKVEAEELFAAGLIHDIGKTIIDQYLTTEFVKILSITSKAPVTMYMVEGKALGFDHCRIGKMMAEKWRFPPSLVDVVAYHHTIDEKRPFAKQAALVHIANSIVQAMEMGYSGNTIVPPIDVKAMEVAEIKPSVLEPVVKEAKTKLPEMVDIFSTGT